MSSLNFHATILIALCMGMYGAGMLATGLRKIGEKLRKGETPSGSVVIKIKEHYAQKGGEFVTGALFILVAVLLIKAFFFPNIWIVAVVVLLVVMPVVQVRISVPFFKKEFDDALKRRYPKHF